MKTIISSIFIIISSCTIATAEKKPSLIVPVGYWNNYKPIHSEQQESLVNILSKIPANIPKDSHLTLRNTLTHINKRLDNLQIDWRTLIEIKLFPSKDLSKDENIFNGKFPKSVDEYLDWPITKIHGQEASQAEIEEEIGKMSILQLIHFSAQSQNLSILWLNNKSIVLINYVTTD